MRHSGIMNLNLFHERGRSNAEIWNYQPPVLDWRDRTPPTRMRNRRSDDGVISDDLPARPHVRPLLFALDHGRPRNWAAGEADEKAAGYSREGIFCLL